MTVRNTIIKNIYLFSRYGQPKITVSNNVTQSTSSKFRLLYEEIGQAEHFVGTIKIIQISKIY